MRAALSSGRENRPDAGTVRGITPLQRDCVAPASAVSTLHTRSRGA